MTGAGKPRTEGSKPENAKMDRYLYLDTETGGLDSRSHSLLSIGLVVGDGNVVKDSIELFIKHEPYVVTGGGMKVNRIDLARHHDTALAPQQALEALEDFLALHFPPEEHIVLVGHNIAFDRAFLGTFLEANGKDLEPRFSHRTVDTHTIAAFLRDAGRLQVEKLSTTALFAHFGIHVPEDKRHTALGDALATFELYWKLVELLR